MKILISTDVRSGFSGPTFQLKVWAALPAY